MRILRHRVKIAVAVCFALVPTLAPAQAQVREDPPTVHIVYMGGNDCPPCVAWRGVELPKLKQSEEFRSVRFTYVTKAIRSPVPPTFFLPEEVKPFKVKLDEASAGRSGSPQTAILVNGEVFDYYGGSRSADEVVRMLAAIRTGTTYPFERCLKWGYRSCEIKR